MSTPNQSERGAGDVRANPTDDRATPWRLQSSQQQSNLGISIAASDAPTEFVSVLRLLHEADRSGNWPSTGKARSSIMRVADPSTGGSFSLRNTANGKTQRGTRGNLEFPELAAAVFNLEKLIAPGRPPSAMVAVNRLRAGDAFLPHKDAGAGLEQSTALIVGLGDYSGGDLVIEGTSHDIRYRALEFDGWQQRHWTAPFEGEERFSLVWFTPADRADGSKQPYGATLDPKYMSGKVRFNIPGFE